MKGFIIFSCLKSMKPMRRKRLALAIHEIVIVLFLALTNSSTALSRIKNDAVDGHYWVGTGIADITGPAAQINFMGYAKVDQIANGIHLRLRARAYVISDGLLEDGSIDPDATICFVSVDIGMGSDLLTSRVLKRVKQLLHSSYRNNLRSNSKTKFLCHEENLSISGTHTHSAPAGFLQYAVFQFTSYGFSHEAMNAYVEGISRAISRAHENMQKEIVHVSLGRLLGASRNRSPSSYLLNPKVERDDFIIDGDTDKMMVQLQFGELGVLNWFAVHGTSMNSTNKLISSDNRGYASYLMEKYMNGMDSLPGEGKFVAAFASTNLGDVSPNINGAACIDTGLPCDGVTSSCNGKSELCVASGPGKDMFESTEIIGRKQFEHALSLIHSNKNKTIHSNCTMSVVEGGVAFRHAYLKMPHRQLTLPNGDVKFGCDAALGYSFAAGTTDGPGDFDFTQGTNSSNVFWNLISSALSKPTTEQLECHHPKPILLNVGSVSKPYPWAPETVPISVFRIGQVLILNVPSEFTTMAGRRLRSAVVRTAMKYGKMKTRPIVTIAGLANSYSFYVTTFEEYQGQRYEGAATLYGPHTLDLYIQEFVRIVKDMFEGNPSATDKAPTDLSDRQLSFLPPVLLDTVPLFKKFGDVDVDAEVEYVAGKDSVSVKFHSANPRNNQRLDGSFLTVEKINADGSSSTKYVDGDWCTKFVWEGNSLSTVSYATTIWDIPEEVEEGKYKICHHGTRRTVMARSDHNYIAKDNKHPISLSKESKRSDNMLLKGNLIDFEGCSKIFNVKSVNDAIK